MNNFSSQLQKSLDELEQWMAQHPDVIPEHPGFFNQLKKLFAQARDAQSDAEAEGLVNTISWGIAHEGPDAVIRGVFLPTFDLIVTGNKKKKKRV